MCWLHELVGNPLFVIERLLLTAQIPLRPWTRMCLYLDAVSNKAVPINVMLAFQGHSLIIICSSKRKNPVRRDVVNTLSSGSISMFWGRWLIERKRLFYWLLRSGSRIDYIQCHDVHWRSISILYWEYVNILNRMCSL